jgi:hypothetical protein
MNTNIQLIIINIQSSNTLKYDAKPEIELRSSKGTSGGTSATVGIKNKHTPFVHLGL